MPAHPAGPDGLEDPIRFKNRLADARRQIRALDDAPSDVSSWFQPAEKLGGNRAFWRGQDNGLAVFLGGELFQVYRTAVPLDELTVVGRTAHIVPLLTAMEEGTEFYLVVVSRENVRLLRGSRSAMSEVSIPGRVNDVDVGSSKARSSDQLQFRTTGSASGGKQVALFHGHASAATVTDEHVLAYLRDIDGAVTDVIGGRRAPLVFAGDVSLFPLYREVNSYKPLVEPSLQGNFDAFSATDLHARAWPLVQEQLAERRQDLLASVLEAIGSGKGSTDVAAVINAAAAGRVGTVILTHGKQLWGRYNADARNVQVLSGRQTDTEDLLNLAAIHTLRNGGDVWIAEPDELPAGDMIAAAYRF
jgi:hypothetical protein